MHNQAELAEFIYKINSMSSFNCNIKKCNPIVGFLYNHSLPYSFIRDLKKKNILLEDTDNIICVLGDWESIAEGIIFTNKAIYVNSSKNKRQTFRIQYDDVKDLMYFSNIPPKLKVSTKNDEFYLDTPLWSKKMIYEFLEFATERYNFSDNNKAIINNLYLEATQKRVGVLAAGITYGNVSNASSIYFDDKIVSPRGHGFAAENANHLADLYLGKKAQIVGNDNMKNGADRLVNGVQIQTKYCTTGSKCVQECFENGQFKYWNQDGTPMQIEVPSDKYEQAVQAMKNRILKGEVPGVTDPSEAKNIIRKGHFTYTQVKNIAKAGTIESITYDAANGVITSLSTSGITALLSYGVALWNGEDELTALKSAAAHGLKVGGTTFATSILAGQLSKAGLNSILVSSSEAIVQIMGPKAAATLVNAFRSGTNIYGAAAMKSAAKLLRGNAITGIASVAILSVVDIGNIFSGRISGGQLFKNITKTASTVAGGSAGWVAGAAVGAAIGSVIPIVGTGIGGIIGGLIGSFGGGTIASDMTGAVLDEFIEDDANQMVNIIQEVFTELAGEYLVTKEGAEKIVEQLQQKLTGRILKDMFASSDKYEFARNLQEEFFKEDLKCRQHIKVPTIEKMSLGLKAILEDIADESIS